MPKYYPIDTGFKVSCSTTNLRLLKVDALVTIADFGFWSDDTMQILRVTFNGECIVRALEEMPLSTEDELSQNEGLVPNHFAYRVEGAAFAAIQSEAWNFVMRPRHYRFLTHEMCLDALTPAQPNFELLEASE